MDRFQKEIYNRIRLMDLNEQIKMEKRYISLNIDWNSVKHFINNHLNLSDEELQNRIKTEHIREASTYVCDFDVLVDAIKEAIINEIYSNHEEFYGWLYDHTDWSDYEIFFDLPESIKGYAYSSKQDFREAHLVCSESKICLMKTDLEVWTIRTSYPILPEK